METALHSEHHAARGPEEVNLDEICRLCRNSRGVMSYIYSSSGIDTSIPLSTRIMEFADVKMCEGDGLPSLICHQCLYHIEKANEFKALCEQSDALLRQYVALQVQTDKSPTDRRVNADHVCNGNYENLFSGIGRTEKDPDDDNLQIKTEGSDDPQCDYEENEFNCPNCNKSFEFYEHLSRHVLIHSQNGPFPCDYCEIDEKDKASLRLHWKEHSSPCSQTCQTCGESFPRKDLLLQHNLMHDKMKKFHCDICSKAFSFKSDLRKHLVIHSGLRPYVCPVCYKSFTRSTNLNKHARLHSGRKPFSCLDCDKMFASRGDLLRHSVIHTGEKPFSCSICSVSFNRKDKLTRHEKVHLLSTERPYMCGECPTSFSRKEELTKHIQFHHYNPDFDYINNDSSEPQDLTVSCKRLKTETNDPVDLDELCETESIVITVDPNNWTEENGIENNVNDIGFDHLSCDTSLVPVSSLHNHEEMRAFVCNICQRGFRRRRELVRHSSIHTGERPHSCETCGKKFARSDKLKRHMITHMTKVITKTEHDVKAPVLHPQCDVCFKTLSTKHELRRHLLTHSLFKPYQCNLCSSSYCRKDKLIKHIKKCHPDTLNSNLKDSDNNEIDS